MEGSNYINCCLSLPLPPSPSLVYIHQPPSSITSYSHTISHLKHLFLSPSFAFPFFFSEVHPLLHLYTHTIPETTVHLSLPLSLSPSVTSCLCFVLLSIFFLGFLFFCFYNCFFFLFLLSSFHLLRNLLFPSFF